MKTLEADISSKPIKTARTNRSLAKNLNMAAIPVTTSLASLNSINKSPSKQMYSFSKSERFQALDKANGCPQVSYNIPSTRTNRSCSFGTGNRFQNNMYKTCAPPPGSYK